MSEKTVTFKRLDNHRDRAEKIPFCLETILQCGGTILDTFTRLHFSIPASRNASSKDCSSCLCFPTPLVKKTFFGTIFFLE